MAALRRLTTAALDLAPSAVLEVAALVSRIQPKLSEGATVFIDSDISNILGVEEHDAGSYWRDVEKIARFASDSLTTQFQTIKPASSL
jgi:hypothetical protein